MYAVLRAKGVGVSRLHKVAQEGCKYDATFLKK